MNRSIGAMPSANISHSPKRHREKGGWRNQTIFQCRTRDGKRRSSRGPKARIVMEFDYPFTASSSWKKNEDCGLEALESSFRASANG
ncbi:hypothetical protein CDAR_310221 [Caerostris darwini]|uniref:Uncharacterized protein n=1 Tax=Caerostris darwini TaxID=1538125 RepID=A0AAV4WTE3_9ARAC|nr:hypothetical protein CDAR_310221 [Caerostris darwini]